jgi:hypothetical protein
MFSESRMGPAGELVPAWVEEMLKSSPSLLGEGDRLP